MSPGPTDAVVDRLVEALQLKAVDRAGWVRAGVERPESVAAHAWGVALLVIVLLPDDLDRERALTYAVLHDLAEARVGDITPHDGISRAQKARLESEALAALLRDLPRSHDLVRTWHAYEAQEDPEARFVRQLDRLDMALQALVYAQAGTPGLHEFVDSAARVIDHPVLVQILDRVRARLC